MYTAINISDELVTQAKTRSASFKRSLAEQIEHWARIGQIAEDNPDLPLPFIQDILTGREQIKAGLGSS
ncbi:MAG: hypothetical protein B6245_04995 [Desulfobacteraceae bacterium 4572_88]|nr:MAG: hypothetical protein B6245_04995 [Desulfobacteraceae bacterium 4572_88]